MNRNFNSNKTHEGELDEPKRTILFKLFRYCLRIIDKIFPGFRAASKHNHDLLFLTIFWIVLIIFGMVGIILCVILAIFYELASSVGPIIALLGALLVVSLNAMQKLFEQANARLAVADLLSSDIISICNVMDTMKIVDKLSALYKSISCSEIPSLDPRYLEARSEVYTDVFKSVCNQLGSLPSISVERVTRFYTYFKACRDSTKVFSLWKNENQDLDRKKEDVIEIGILIALCLKNAQESVVLLMEEYQINLHKYSLKKLDNNLKKSKDLLIYAGLDESYIEGLGI